MRRAWIGLLVAAMLVGRTRAYAANPVAEAQLAFDEGRRLEDAGDFAAAATRFEESERLEPALGTILNLASCYERGRRFASAWRAFRRGADEATALGETKRALRATDRADALTRRLSSLVVRTEGVEAPGEEIRIDGAMLDRADWAAPRPIDGGKHSVVARAPGREEWSFDVQISDEGERSTVAVPALLPAPARADAMPPAEASRSVSPTLPPTQVAEARAPATTWTPIRLGAIASGAVGLVAIGFGVGYGLQARSQWNDRQADCAYNYCNDAGYALTSEAQGSAMRSTVAFAIGGAGLAAGAVLFALSPSRKAGVSVAGEALPGGAAVRMRGAF